MADRRLNPLFLGNPEDHCATCGTCLKAHPDDNTRRRCPLGCEPESAA